MLMGIWCFSNHFKPVFSPELTSVVSIIKYLAFVNGTSSHLVNGGYVPRLIIVHREFPLANKITSNTQIIYYYIKTKTHNPRPYFSIFESFQVQNDILNGYF